MEYLDIVDENNKYTGIKKERSRVHAEGDWHRTVHVYVFNGIGELLVHLRSPFKDLYPNCWDTRFGGHVLAGETTEKTLLKEFEEEIGIEVNLNNFIKGETYKHNKGKNKEFTEVYYFKYENQDLKFNDNEVVEVKWMSLGGILEELKISQDKWTTKAETIKEIFKNWENLK